MVDTEDTDLGYRDALRGLQALGDLFALVGVRSEKSGDELVQIAAVNEFGSQDGRIPERSFLRAAADEGADYYLDVIEEAIQQIIKAGDLSDGIDTMQRLGVEVVGDVQEFMVELSDPPNADSTIARKGSDNPLIDTGRLRQAITYVVVAEAPKQSTTGAGDRS